MNLLFSAAPAAKEMFKMAAERGFAIGSMTSKLLTLLDLYGGTEMDEACQGSGRSRCVPLLRRDTRA